MKPKILIYGGAGFVGSALTRALVSKSYEVTVIDNYSIATASDPVEGAKYVEANVVDSWITDSRKEPDVYPFAQGEYTIVWLAAVQGYTRTLDEFGQNNVYPLFNLFEAIRYFKAADRINRIVLASSQAVYAPGRRLTEMFSRTEPISAYGVSKLCQEQALDSLARLYGINYLSLRYPVILGKGQSYDSMESGVMRNWTRSFQKGLGSEVYGDGLQIRDFVHIDDVTEVNIKAIEKDCKFMSSETRAFNVGGFDCSVIDLAYIFQEASGSAEPRVLSACPRSDGGVHDFTNNYDRAYQALGYEPQAGLGSQVADAFNHFNSIK